jgi:hypothetical protein
MKENTIYPIRNFADLEERALGEKVRVGTMSAQLIAKTDRGLREEFFVTMRKEGNVYFPDIHLAKQEGLETYPKEFFFIWGKPRKLGGVKII